MLIEINGIWNFSWKEEKTTFINNYQNVSGSFDSKVLQTLLSLICKFYIVIYKRMCWNKALVISYQAYMSKFFDVFKKFALSFNLSKITLTLLSSTYYFKQPLTQNEIWLWKDFKTKRFAKAFSRTTSDVGLNHNHWLSWFLSANHQIIRQIGKVGTTDQ